jgi:hypothetical protein
LCIGSVEGDEVAAFVGRLVGDIVGDRLQLAVQRYVNLSADLVAWIPGVRLDADSASVAGPWIGRSFYLPVGR